jgi:hypothetical protein
MDVGRPDCKNEENWLGKKHGRGQGSSPRRRWAVEWTHHQPLLAGKAPKIFLDSRRNFDDDEETS